MASQLNYCYYGMLYGNKAQGVQVSTSNFTGNSFGLVVRANQIGNDQLAVSSSQFNNGVADIYTASQIDGVTLTGNFFYGGANTSGTICVNLNNTDQFSITGNTFVSLGPNQNAIVIGDYTQNAGVISANVISGAFTTGIWLRPNSKFVNVQSNSYFGVVGTVNNQGTNNTVGGGSS